MKWLRRLIFGKQETDVEDQIDHEKCLSYEDVVNLNEKRRKEAFDEKWGNHESEYTEEELLNMAERHFVDLQNHGHVGGTQSEKDVFEPPGDDVFRPI